MIYYPEQFRVFSRYILQKNLLGSNIIESLFIYYFVGIVVSRIGLVIVEPLCKKCKWVKFADYGQYIAASKNDSKLEILSETSNTFRTILSMCLLFLVGKLYFYICSKVQFVKNVEADFLEKVCGDIECEEVDVLFAPHYGRESGKIPKEILDEINPQIIVVGEAPSKHLNYYSDFNTITQNSSGDIIFNVNNSLVDVYVGNSSYSVNYLVNRNKRKYNNYIGSFEVNPFY